MSLKSGLFQEIKNAYPKIYTIDQAESYAKINGYKISNYERRLRELCEPNETGYAPVRTIKNKKNFIVGYVYQEPQRLEFKKNINIEFGGQQGQLAGIETYQRY